MVRRIFKLIYNLLGISKWCSYISINAIKDYLYDEKLGIETIGDYYKKDSSSQFGDYESYQPIPYGKLEKTINHLKLKKDDVFVDIGCGKGRVLFLVGNKKIKKVIGLELRKKLVNTAKKNLAKLKLKNANVEIYNCDACNFDFREATVIFMYNPFGYKTMKTVLRNIQKSLISNPRKIRIVYYVPMLRGLLDDTRWLEPKGEINKTNVFVWYNRLYYNKSKKTPQ